MKGKVILLNYLVVCIVILYSAIPLIQPVMAVETTDPYIQDSKKINLIAPKENTLTVAYDTEQEKISFPILKSVEGNSIEDIIWECGNYVFTAKLKEGYLTQDNKPIIVTVSVEDKMTTKDEAIVTSKGVTMFAVNQSNINYVDSGTWGECNWRVEGDALLVEPGQNGNVPGVVDDTPWSANDGNRADMSRITRIVIKGKSSKNGLCSLFENYISPEAGMDDEINNQSLNSITSIDLTEFDTSVATKWRLIWSLCFII